MLVTVINENEDMNLKDEGVLYGQVWREERKEGNGVITITKEGIF